MNWVFRQYKLTHKIFKKMPNAMNENIVKFWL